MLQVGHLVRSVTDLELRLSKLEQDRIQHEERMLPDSARGSPRPQGARGSPRSFEAVQTEPRPAATQEVAEAMQRLAEAKMFCEEAEEARLAAEEALHFERDWRRSEMQHAADLAVQVSELARQLALTRVNSGSIGQPSEEGGQSRRGIEWPRDGVSATVRAAHQDERFHTEDAPSFVIPAFQSNRLLGSGSQADTRLPSPRRSSPPRQQSPAEWVSAGPWQRQQQQQQPQQSQLIVRCGRGQQADLSRIATPARSRPYPQAQSGTGGVSVATTGVPTWSPKLQFRSVQLCQSSNRGSPVGIRQRSCSIGGEGSPQSPRPPVFALPEQQQQQEQALRRKWRYSLPSAAGQNTLRADGSRGNLTKGQSVIVMPAHQSPKPACRASTQQASVTVNPWVPLVPPVAASAASGTGCPGNWLTPRGPSLAHSVPGVMVTCSGPTLPVPAVSAPPVFQGAIAPSAASVNSGIPAYVDRSAGMVSTVRAGSPGHVAALSPLAQHHMAMNSRSP